MLNHLKSSLAATAIALTLAGTGLVATAKAGADLAGVVTVKSDYTVAETVSRIKRDVAKKGIMLFGVIDQAKLGNAAGNEVRPSRLVMFGNPALGTTFITANPEAGLDWPVRVLVYQAADGGVYAAYTDFDWIAKRHGIDNRDKEFKMATEVIEFRHIHRPQMRSRPNGRRTNPYTHEVVGSADWPTTPSLAHLSQGLPTLVKLPRES